MAFNPNNSKKPKRFTYEFVMSSTEGVPSCYFIKCETEVLGVPVISLEKVQSLVEFMNEVQEFLDTHGQDWLF